MSENYRQFSERIDDLKSAEQDWIQGVMGCEDDVAQTLKDSGIRIATIDVDCWPGFEYRLEDVDAYLWIYAEESGNAHH